jgi:hypothetical protein
MSVLLTATGRFLIYRRDRDGDSGSAVSTYSTRRSPGGNNDRNNDNSNLTAVALQQRARPRPTTTIEQELNSTQSRTGGTD